LFKLLQISYFNSPSFSPNRVGIRNSTDYSPFGVELDGRTVSLDGYRFGFQNQEKVNEIKGDGNTYDFGNRIQDPRIGRFFSIDKYFRKYPNETNYCFASNCPISAIDLNGDSTYLIIYGAGYLNYTMVGGGHDVGKGFLLNAQALKKKIESSSSFDPNRDEVVLVYAPSASRFLEATNTTYKSGKIVSLTVFSHGSGFSETNGTRTGSVCLGGEKPGEIRPDGTTVTQNEAVEQKNDYDLREINGNNIDAINKTNFERTATCTFYGCWLGGDQNWTDEQIKAFSFAQRFANTTGLTTKAFTSSGLFKTNSSGKIVYDGTMIRAIDTKSQKTRLSIFKPNTSPTVIRK